MLEEVKCVLIYEGVELSKVTLHDIILEKIRYSTQLEIRFPVDMTEISDNNMNLIENAVKRNGKASARAIKTPALLLGAIRIGTAKMSDELSVFVDFVDVFSVYSRDWRTDGKNVDTCNQGEVIEREFRISKTGKTTGTLQAEIIEISQDGGQRPIEKILFQDALTENYQDYYLSMMVPDSPPLNCIGYSIRLLYEGIEIWSSSLDQPSINFLRQYSLSEAVEDDKFTLRLSGRGYCSGDTIKLQVKIEGNITLNLEIESGTVLINSGAGQNMITGETAYFKIEPKIEIEVTLEAYCLDLFKDNPNATEVFDVLSDSGEYNYEVITLMKSLESTPWEHKSVPGIHLALWVVVDNPDREEVERSFYVSESSLEDAEWLLNNIGINPYEKELFKEG